VDPKFTVMMINMKISKSKEVVEVIETVEAVEIVETAEIVSLRLMIASLVQKRQIMRIQMMKKINLPNNRVKSSRKINENDFLHDVVTILKY
jgi:hypothetical protein